MNLLKTIFEYDDHWTHEDADYSTTQITGGSRYQIYLANQNTPKTHKIKTEDKVTASLGTGFHMRAEQVINASDLDVQTEVSLFGEISGHKISGTADVIYDNGLETIVGDFKTKGHFGFIKALDGDVDDIIRQLSVYAYLYADKEGSEMATKGQIYLVRTGDNKFLSKADKINYPYGVPRYKTIEVTLMTVEEVEEMVATRALGSEQVDCEVWRCSWCEYQCEHRKEK